MYSIHSLNLQAFSPSLFPFYRDENGDPRTPRDEFGFPPFDQSTGLAMLVHVE